MKTITESQWLAELLLGENPPAGAFTTADVRKRMGIGETTARATVRSGVASGAITFAGYFRGPDRQYRRYYKDAKGKVKT